MTSMNGGKPSSSFLDNAKRTVCEVWKRYKSTDYDVSSFGNLRSRVTGKALINRQTNSCGYYRVQLVIDGKRCKLFIHRMVAETFLKHSKKKTQVNHINGNKKDNRLENLEWCTPSENQLHARYVLGKNDEMNDKMLASLDKFYAEHKERIRGQAKTAHKELLRRQKISCALSSKRRRKRK